MTALPDLKFNKFALDVENLWTDPDPAPTLGEELAPPLEEDGTDWIIDEDGGVILEGGVAHFTGEQTGPTNIHLENFYSIGTTYQISYEIFDYEAGEVYIWSGTSGIRNTANGFSIENLTVSSGWFYLSCPVDFVGKIRNLSIREYTAPSGFSITETYAIPHDWGIAGLQNAIVFGDNSVQRDFYGGIAISEGSYLLSCYVEMNDHSVPTSSDFYMVMNSWLSTFTVQHISGSIYRLSQQSYLSSGTPGFGIIKATGQSSTGFKCSAFMVYKLPTCAIRGPELIQNPRFEYVQGGELVPIGAMENFTDGVADGWSVSGTCDTSEVAGVGGVGSAQAVGPGDAGNLVQASPYPEIWETGKQYKISVMGKRLSGTGTGRVRLLSTLIGGASADVISFDEDEWTPKSFIFTSQSSSGETIRLYCTGDATVAFDKLTVHEVQLGKLGPELGDTCFQDNTHRWWAEDAILRHEDDHYVFEYDEASQYFQFTDPVPLSPNTLYRWSIDLRLHSPSPRTAAIRFAVDRGWQGETALQTVSMINGEWVTIHGIDSTDALQNTFSVYTTLGEGDSYDIRRASIREVVNDWVDCPLGTVDVNNYHELTIDGYRAVTTDDIMGPMQDVGMELDKTYQVGVGMVNVTGKWKLMASDMASSHLSLLEDQGGEGQFVVIHDSNSSARVGVFVTRDTPATDTDFTVSRVSIKEIFSSPVPAWMTPYLDGSKPAPFGTGSFRFGAALYDMEVQWLEGLTGQTGHRRDLWHAYFDQLGISSGHLRDRQFEWLEGLGYQGTLHDMLVQYWS